MNSNLIYQKLKVGFGIFLTITFIWMGVITDNLSFTNVEQNVAHPSQPILLAMDSNVVDNVFGSGTTDQIKGKAEQDIGTVQKNIGDVKGQAKGTLKEIKGRSQQDIGKVKNRLDEAGSDVEDASENLLDAAKNLLGK